MFENSLESKKAQEPGRNQLDRLTQGLKKHVIKRSFGRH